MLQNLKYAVYNLNGRKPWSRGYIASRTRFIKDTLENKDFDVCHLPKEYGRGFDERVVEYPWFFKLLPTAPAKILDAGSVLNFDYILNHVNLKNKSLAISTLAPEEDCFWRKGISYVYEDLRRSCFRNEEFDLVVSLSTLEHVGCDNSVYTKNVFETEVEKGNFIEAVIELKRVLKPNGKLLISVPFGAPVNHGWLQVFDSDKLDALIKAFNPSSFQEWIYKYDEQNGWSLSNRQEAGHCGYYNKIQPALNSKPWIAAAEAVACIELIK